MFKKIFSLVTAFTLALNLAAIPVLATTIEVTGNGESSVNEAQVVESQETTITQSNQGEVNNDVTIDANTGNNQALDNGGDASIVTGDVTTNTTIQNNLNQSQATVECCPQDTEIKISGNGADSQNTVNLTNDSTTTATVNQTATIENHVTGFANTGYNFANDNAGNVTIMTGNIFIKEKITNKHVNQAFLTLPQQTGSNISARIVDNGAGSVNDIRHEHLSLVTAVVDNVADITNRSNWHANTGYNFASDNLGDVSITTGDIKVLIDIENDVNYSEVEVTCCEEKPTPTPTPPPGPTPSPPPSKGNGGGGGGGDGEAGAAGGGGNGGQILPVTGNNLLLTLTFINLLLLTFGTYLKTPKNRQLKLTFSFA